MINLVVNIDKNYIEKMLVTLTSIFSNTKLKINLHILTFDDEINHKELKEKLNSLFKGKLTSISIIKLSSFEFNHTKHFFLKHISIAAYGRIFIPDVLKHLSKVIYIDSDLVFNYDIKELWETNISKHNIAGVKESWFTHFQRLHLHKKYPYLKNMKNSSYINSGVMVLNPKKLNEEKFSEKVSNFFKENKKIHFGDQDIINYLLPEKKIIDSSWNVTLNFFLKYRYNIFNKAKVVHYVSAAKPWRNRIDLKLALYFLLGVYRTRLWKKYKKELDNFYEY